MKKKLVIHISMVNASEMSDFVIPKFGFETCCAFQPLSWSLSIDHRPGLASSCWVGTLSSVLMLPGLFVHFLHY